MKNKFLISICLLIPSMLFAQEVLTGTIKDKNYPKKDLGIFGANVYWLHTSVGATTNKKGEFKIPYKKECKKLISKTPAFKAGKALKETCNL